MSVADTKRASGGVGRKALILDRVLATDPDILLLGEPTPNLDLASIIAIARNVSNARDSNVRIILVTRDDNQAQRLGDGIVFLQAGRVVELSRPNVFSPDLQDQTARDYLNGKIIV